MESSAIMDYQGALKMNDYFSSQTNSKLPKLDGFGLDFVPNLC